MTPRRSRANKLAVTFRVLFVALASVFAVGVTLAVGGLCLAFTPADTHGVLAVALIGLGVSLAGGAWPPLRKARRELRDERQLTKALAVALRNMQASPHFGEKLPALPSVSHDGMTWWRWDEDHWTLIDAEHPVALTWITDDSAALTPCQPTAEERDE